VKSEMVVLAWFLLLWLGGGEFFAVGWLLEELVSISAHSSNK